MKSPPSGAPKDAAPTLPTQQIATPYDLSPEQIGQFCHDGFIKLKNVFDAETLEYYGRVITEQTMAQDSLKGVYLRKSVAPTIKPSFKWAIYGRIAKRLRR